VPIDAKVAMPQIATWASGSASAPNKTGRARR
jgi:hypothetical protein